MYRSRNALLGIVCFTLLSVSLWLGTRSPQPSQDPFAGKPTPARSVRELPGDATTAATTLPNQDPGNAFPAAPSPQIPAQEPRSRSQTNPRPPAPDTLREPAFASFDAWTREYVGAADAIQRDQLSGEGIQRATLRRAAMFSMIQTDPQRALELAVPLATREQLPAAVTAQLETRVSGRGDYDVLAVYPLPGREDDVVPIQRYVRLKENPVEYRAFVYGVRQDHPTGRGLPLHGVVIDDVLALSEHSVRHLEPMEVAAWTSSTTASHHAGSPEALCTLSAHPIDHHSETVLADVGGEIKLFCSEDHLAAFNEELTAAAGQPGGNDISFPVGNRNYSEGRKRLIIMRVAFANVPNPTMTQAEGLDLVARVDEWLTRVSYGRTTIAPVGQGSDVIQVTLPANSTVYDDSAGSMRNDVRAKARADGVNLDLYDFDITATGSQPSFDWAGLGFVGAPGSWIRSGSGNFGTGVTVHELGHNFDLPHGNFYNTGGQSAIGPGDNQEYGDIFDVMGSGGSGNGDYCARFKNHLGWISNADYPLISSSSRFRLFSHDNPDARGLRGFQVVRQGSLRYSFEFRQRFTGNPWLMNGLGVRWGSGRSSQLIDTTPGSSEGRDDSPIILGRTYSDEGADVPVHITPLRLGNTYPQSMDVQVHIGAFPGNRPPVFRLAYDALDAGPNAPLNFTAQATDPDGDELAYAWEFEDDQFGPNLATVSRAWSASGEYVVRCTVSDMKGGATSKSVRVRIGAPSTFSISGRVLENGTPLAGVRVQASGSRYAYTDSDGTYTITRLGSGSYTVSATLHPFTFVHPWFDNPVNVGPSAGAIDFISVDTPVDDTLLVAENAVWKYLDNGSDQGTAWRAPGFVDTAWASGPAQLGYGDGDEATVVSFGPDSGNKYITTYFRHTFNVANPGALTNLNLGFLRDDGGIVYLNGVEVRRDNMPAGAVTYLTTSDGAIPNGDEDLFFTSSVDISLLNAGNNTLAAEIHQAGGTSSDISFAARLTATTATNFQGLSLFYIASPANDQNFNPGANVPVTVNAFNSGGSFTRMEFFGDGVSLGQDASEPFSINWPAPSLGEHVLTVIATDNGGVMSTSAPVTFRVTASPILDLVSFGSNWRYLDDGSDPGTAWKDPGFSDGTWAVGPAELGYGDGDEATVVSFGPNANAKYVTTYFRGAFQVEDPASIVSLNLNLIRDDGAVVYLNGTEVLRNNMPAGTIGYQTLASAGVSGSQETTPVQANLSPALLTTGLNTVAVEIHQNSLTSSDISFDLSLQAMVQVNAAAEVALTAPAEGALLEAPAQITLAATASAAGGFALTQVEFYQGTTRLGADTTSPYSLNWSDVSPGAYALTARAYQNNGVILTSAPVNITVTPPALARQLVAPGSYWQYLDQGIYPGDNWTSRSYSDIHWLPGRARLGYGGDGETTVIRFGSDPSAKHITTWFRHTFTALDAYDGLKVRLQRDDGAVVYLNGTEIMRDNLLTGPVNPSSLALTTANGADETTFFEAVLPGHLLTPGANLIAVEVHQASLDSSDLGFDLELLGLSRTNLAEGVYLTQPADGSQTLAGATIALAAYAVSPAGVIRVEFYDGEVKLGEDASSPYTYAWAGAAEGAHSLTARAVTSVQTLVSAPVSLTVQPLPPTIIPVQATLIGAGSNWRYWDAGSRPAPNWMDQAYSDSAWPTGIARMGFGLDGELTTLNSGITTAYFRRNFNASSPAAFASFNLRFQRDDGIAIYLNGLEIYRNNLPGGPLDYNVPALSGVSGLDEQYFFELDLSTSGSGIKRGSNLVAVEVHQVGDSQSDFGFDLQLLGRGSTEARVFLARPIQGSLFARSESIAMEAFPFAGPANSIERVDFFANGVKIGEKSASPYDLNWSTDTAGTYQLTVQATDVRGRVLTSQPLEVLVGFETSNASFVAAGSTWRYLDNGSDQGTAWREPGFNDSAWAAGPAQLGYGDGDEATVVGFGPSSGNKYVTTYFRHTFNLAPGTLARDLSVLLLRDDGGIVYLNGTEIFRDNMPGDPITYLTSASGSVGGADEDTFFLASVDPALLVPGDNVVAVEIHQVNGTSSDISFDLQLVGTALIPSLGPPSLTIRRLPGQMIELAWPVQHEGWSLYNAVSVDPGSAWQQVFSPVEVRDGENIVTLLSSSSVRFFRLQKD